MARRAIHKIVRKIANENHKRIEEAKKLLLTTNDTIHEIGSKVGIHNTNHFINLFKRETGATPLAFKQDAPVSISELHYL